MTKTVQDFWNGDANPIIKATEQHPFLVAMVDGSLPKEPFQYYVIQDALYLKDFAFCLRYLGEKRRSMKTETENFDVDADRLLAFAHGAEEAEMSLHNSFFKQWKIDMSSNSSNIHPQMPHTLLYTSYMIQVITTRPYAEGLAVLLPCFWVYAHVGEIMLQLRTDRSATNTTSIVTRPPVYDAWIDMYGGEEFHKEVSDYKDLVNQVLLTVDTATYAAMQQHFLMCCQLEYMFWDQALTCMTWPAIGGGSHDDVIDDRAKTA
jgi:thiaminase (transcriptional activator TenA)